MSLRLNIQESSLKKKRGLSFFQQKRCSDIMSDEKVGAADEKQHGRGQSFDLLDQQFRDAEAKFQAKLNGTRLAIAERGGETMFDSQQDAVTAINTSTALGVDQEHRRLIPCPQITVDALMTPASGATFQHSSLPTSLQMASKRTDNLPKHAPKEIVSALVRLNTQGLQIPLNMEDMKRLPNIPSSAIPKSVPMKKKMLTDMGPAIHVDELDEFDDTYHQLTQGSKSNRDRVTNGVRDLDMPISEDAITVFDLVHRGRQRQKHFKQLQRQVQNTSQHVHSPKIISPTSSGAPFAERSLAPNMSFVSAKARQQSNLLGRKNLSIGSGTATFKTNTGLIIRPRDKKLALREFNKEVASAMLPDIESALMSKRARSLEYKRKSQPRRKRIEYLHEEFYDEQTKGKWTIFNKHAVEVDDLDDTNLSEHEFMCPEDSILEDIRLDERINNGVSTSTIPDTTWHLLYEAKCMDLSIPSKSEKQLERFTTQMKLHQRDDRISLRDQGMSYQSAIVIGKKMLANNANLTKIDLSNNQLQTNFKQIVHGVKKNDRLIQLVMRNNQLNGTEHGEDIKDIIRDHPSLAIIDLSNNEMNVNKNKLRNVGAVALVDGILESTMQGYSLINDINLSYNFLTADSLPHFARLNDPDFIRLEHLNLGYNQLGADSVKTLRPILSNILSLNLSNSKLNNHSMADLAQTFKQQTMKLQELDIHSNQITTEGLEKLLNCLKTHNKVKKLNISKNLIANDVKGFRCMAKFLNANHVLEDLNLAGCDIGPKCAIIIGRGLRGNMNLQSLILRDNAISGGLVEISRSFCDNKKALCLKVLDISKCQLIDRDITPEFTQMLASPYTTLRHLSLRDNLIRYEASERIRDALDSNKSIIKLAIDYNPIKQEVADEIEKICRRNLALDAIEEKNKNVAILREKRARSTTQKQSLCTEINDLKKKTDATIRDINTALYDVEKFQNNRPISQQYSQGRAFIRSQKSLLNHARSPYHSNCGSVVRLENAAYIGVQEGAINEVSEGGDSSYFKSRTGLMSNKYLDPSALSNPQILLEPNTALTAQTSKSIVQQGRHMQQGPMRTEKVYMMTKLVSSKIAELQDEKRYLQQRFHDTDEQCEQQKKALLDEYKEMEEEHEQTKLDLKDSQSELLRLEQAEIEIKQRYAKEVQDMKDRIQVLELGKQAASSEISEINKELFSEDKRISVYLERDKEKLKYAQDMLQTRHLVMMSFKKELERQLKKLNPDLPERQVYDEKMELGRNEFRRIMSMREREKLNGSKERKAPRRKTVKSSSRAAPSDSSKMTSTSNYQNVKSRLFQSIQSSRLKEQKKFVDPNAQKYIHNLEKQKDDQRVAYSGHEIDENSVVDSTNKRHAKFFSHSKTQVMKTENGSMRNSVAKSKQLVPSVSGGDIPMHYDTNSKARKSAVGFNAPPDLNAGAVSRRKTVMFRQSQQEKENMSDAAAVYRSLSNAAKIMDDIDMGVGDGIERQVVLDQPRPGPSGNATLIDDEAVVRDSNEGDPLVFSNQKVYRHNELSALTHQLELLNRKDTPEQLLGTDESRGKGGILKKRD